MVQQLRAAVSRGLFRWATNWQFSIGHLLPIIFRNGHTFPPLPLQTLGALLTQQNGFRLPPSPITLSTAVLLDVPYITHTLINSARSFCRFVFLAHPRQWVTDKTDHKTQHGDNTRYHTSALLCTNGGRAAHWRTHRYTAHWVRHEIDCNCDTLHRVGNDKLLYEDETATCRTVPPVLRSFLSPFASRNCSCSRVGDEKLLIHFRFYVSIFLFRSQHKLPPFVPVCAGVIGYQYPGGKPKALTSAKPRTTTLLMNYLQREEKGKRIAISTTKSI